MKKILPVLLISLSFTSCMRNVIIGSGNKINDTRTVTSFSAVDISAPVDASITIQDGATPSLQLSGYENLQKNIKTEVHEGKLLVYVPKGTELSTSEKVKMTIVLPALNSVSLSGATDAQLHGDIRCADFNLDISGASDVVIDNLNVEKFTADVSGAAKVNIMSGHTNAATYDMSGAAKIRAFGLTTLKTDASLSGAGVADVEADGTLNVHLSGVGAVHYKGHPVITTEKSGVGVVSDAN